MPDPDEHARLLAVTGNFAKVLLDHLTVVGAEFTRDLLKGGATLFGRKVAPSRAVLVLAVLNVAGPFLTERLTVVGRLAALPSARRLLLLFLKLLFNLFDDLVELRDNLLFFGADTLSRSAKIEPPLDVAHQASNFVWRIDLQGSDVGRHQPGQLLVPSRNLARVFEQFVGGFHTGRFVEQPV